MCNYLKPFLASFPPPANNSSVEILGIDVKCGTPILDIKNWLRSFGIFDVQLSAFTQDAAYWLDLNTICKGIVSCDREEFLAESFPNNYFDYIVADRSVNRYHEPQKVLNDIFSMCKSGGYVICKLKNTGDYQEYVNMIGNRETYDPDFSYNISFEVFQKALEHQGKIIRTVNIPYNIDNESRSRLYEMLPRGTNARSKNTLINRMLTKEYLFLVRKPL